MKLPRTAQPARGSGMWWTDGPGAVLVDGIYATRTLFGRVVDLCGDQQATLSVDRRTLRSHDHDLVHDRSMGAIDELLESSGTLNPAWLGHLWSEDATLAEAILVEAARRQVTWSLDHWQLDVARTGLFEPDLLLLPTATGQFHDPAQTDRLATLLILCMPEPVLRWRLRTLLGIDFDAPEPTATPTDTTLLITRRLYMWPRSVYTLTEHAFPPVYGMPARRNRSFQIDDPAVELLHALLPWLGSTPVTDTEVLDAAHRASLPVSQTADRLRAIGYELDIDPELAHIGQVDLPLLCLNRPVRSTPPVWLPRGGWVPLAHLYTQERPALAAERLARLGYRVPDVPTPLPEQHADLPAESRDALTFLPPPEEASVPGSEHEARSITVRKRLHIGGRGFEHTTRHLEALGFHVRVIEQSVLVTDYDNTPPRRSDSPLPTPAALRAIAEILNTSEEEVRETFHENDIPCPPEGAPTHDLT
ncbi:hypothetical protein, partial [Streptomyces boluensis]